MDEAWTHGEATVNGIRLHWVEMGSGPPVVLLHGFPEFWYAWRHQLPALAGAGYRAVAADLRGYAGSDKPEGVEAYRIQEVVDDVRGLIAHLGGRAHVVGHDFGGAAAWYLAMLAPEMVDRLVIINCPHPVAMRRELGTWDQRLRSWYAAFFQLPAVPEIVLRAGRFALLRRALRREPARPGAFTDDDLARYVEAWSQPGALRGMLHHYRAYRLRKPRPLRISRPTLLVWGMRDPHLSPRLLDGLEPWVEDLRIERIPQASHWVMADVPDRLDALLREFLAG